jgi:hypothetical protein
MRRSTCNDPPLGYKREAKSWDLGGGRLEENETLLKFVQGFSSIQPVGLKKLRLFRGTPVCSRQTPILQPTAIGVAGSTVGANRICKRSTSCVICKDRGFRAVRLLVVVHSAGSVILHVKRLAWGNRVFWV